MTARSTIGSGAAEAVRTRRTTWSCCMPTVIGRSTCENDEQKRPRPARGVCEGLSCMKGNFHVQFLGEGAAVTPPPYPAEGCCAGQMEQSQGSGLSAHALVQWPGSGHFTSGQ